MGNWWNAHRDGVENTCTREYEEAVKRAERKNYDETRVSKLQVETSLIREEEKS